MHGPAPSPLPIAAADQSRTPPSTYGLMISSRPPLMSAMPCSTPAWLTLVIPNARRHADHRSSSLFQRIKRLKFRPQTRSLEEIMFRVENGIATVAVQPKSVRLAAAVQIPPHAAPQS